MGSVPGSGRSPGGRHGNSLQYSCLKNPIDRGVWRATVRSCEELDTTEVTQHARMWRQEVSLYFRIISAFQGPVCDVYGTIGRSSCSMIKRCQRKPCRVSPLIWRKNLETSRPWLYRKHNFQRYIEDSSSLRKKQYLNVFVLSFGLLFGQTQKCSSRFVSHKYILTYYLRCILKV